MRSPPEERRLTAILAADVVGYSRLMDEDEAGTLAALKRHRKELIDPKASQYNGRTIKLMGDGALMEFPSVVEAVTFAVEFQLAMAERNRDVPEDQSILYRIGINIGDVIADGDDIYGAGVNVAARVEPLAEPGGIAITRNVLDQVRGRLHLRFSPMGSHEVKNVSEPIEVYAVQLDDQAVQLATPVIAPDRTPRRRTLVAAMAVIVLAVAGGLAATWSEWRAPIVREAAAGSILVLPFDDLSASGDLGYFADGMTEDVITELSRWDEFRVVARNSAETFKDRTIDVRNAAREMGVRYVLEGSVRKSEDTVRITAQLIDGKTGHHVWAERFDETGSDVLALQDRVTDRIVATLGGDQGAIRAAEHKQAWAKAKVDLDEYDYYLRGHSVFFDLTPEAMAEARRIWLEGLEKYPDSGLLKIKLGWTYFNEGAWGYVDDRVAAMAKAETLCEEGLTDPDLPAAGYRAGLWLAAFVSLYLNRDYDKTILIARRVVDLFPYDPETLYWMAEAATPAGELHLADQWITTANGRIKHPIPYYNNVLGRLRFAQARYADTVAAFEEALDLPERLWYLAAAHQVLGETAKAKHYAARLAAEHPQLTTEDVRNDVPFRDGDVPDRLLDLLNKAGWNG